MVFYVSFRDYKNHVSRDYSLSSFQMIMEAALFPFETSSIDNSTDKLSGFEYADNVVLVNDDPGRLQVFLHRMNNSMRKGIRRKIRTN